MKFTMEGNEKEIANFVLALQNRQNEVIDIDEFKAMYEKFRHRKSRDDMLSKPA